MSIVERAANLFDKQVKVSPPAPVDDVATEKFDTAAVDLIERSIEQESAKSDIQVIDSNAAASRDARDFNALAQGPVSQRVTPTLIIDLDRLRQQNMTTPDGERTPVSESFRRIKRHILATKCAGAIDHAGHFVGLAVHHCIYEITFFHNDLASDAISGSK